MEHNWDYYFGFVGQADYYRPRITEGVHGKYGPAKLYEGEYVDTLLTQKAVEWFSSRNGQNPSVSFSGSIRPTRPSTAPRIS